MRKIILSSQFLLLSCLVAIAQGQDEQQLTARVEQLREALLSGNRAALEELTAPELSYGHSSGTLEDKAAFVEALASGKSDFTKVEFSNQTIKVSGNTAWVRHEQRGEANGAPVNIGVLLVWQKQKGKWVLLARQAYKL